MARRQPQLSVSLFPFLAVLVCAMGSLILLLLVMTRKIRQDQDSAPSPVIAVAAIPAVPDRSSELAALESELALRNSEVQSTRAQRDALQSAVDQRAAETDALRSELAAVQASVADIHSDGPEVLDNARRERDDAVARETVLKAQLTERETELLRLRAELASRTTAADQAARVLHEQHSALISLRAAADRVRQRPADDGTTTLLEFSNATGTRRLPLVIDVSLAGYELLPHGPRISAAQMEGFPVRDNPLLSAILAAHRHRSANAVAMEPYVLLLVRPDGSLPFYGAQRILTEARIHYGYELLEPQQKVAVPDVSAEELALIRAAIGDALRRRENLYAKLQAMAADGATGFGPNGLAAPGSPAGTEPAGRRFAIRPDGRVVAGDLADARRLDGRNYAGGEAPPAAHLRSRPAGGYGNTPVQSLTPEEAEGLAEEFAAAWAKQQQEAANGHPDPSAGSDGTSRSDESDRFDRVADVASPLDSFTPRRPKAQGGTASSGFAATTPASENIPSSAVADLSRIDPQLLERLAPERSSLNSVSSPVGITVFVDETHLTVNQQPALELTPGQADAALAGLLTGINLEVEDVRRHSREPLLPIVKFIVSPGGERWRMQLDRELRRLSIRTVTDYELSPYIQSAGEPGRARLESSESAVPATVPVKSTGWESSEDQR